MLDSRFGFEKKKNRILVYPQNFVFNSCNREIHYFCNNTIDQMNNKINIKIKRRSIYGDKVAVDTGHWWIELFGYIFKTIGVDGSLNRRLK